MIMVECRALYNLLFLFWPLPLIALKLPRAAQTQILLLIRSLVGEWLRSILYFSYVWTQEEDGRAFDLILETSNLF
jgi:hypothetical protein